MILVIDVSTSFCKVHLFESYGEWICTEQQKYNIKSPQTDWVEVNPENVWEKICTCIKKISLKIDIKEIDGIGVTAQLGIVLVDNNGNALSPILTWMDKRAKSQAEKVSQVFSEDKIYHFSGRRIDPELSALKMLWFKENSPDLYNKGYKFLSFKDYIISRFTGKFGIDPTHASYTMLYNIKDRKWETDFIHSVDLDESKLPDVHESNKIIGTVNDEASSNTGLPVKIPLVVGGPDGTIGTVGAGLISTGIAINLVGTTDVFFACSNKPIFDVKMRTIVNCHLIPDMWIVGGPMGMTGGCLEWFLNEFGQIEKEIAKNIGCSAFYLLDRETLHLKNNIEDLLFFTGLTGNRTPNWDSNFRGTILGISPYHTRGHLVRSILEGSSFAVKQLIDILEDLGVKINEIRMIGGGAQSPVWQQIRADITGKKHTIPKMVEATAFGTFMAVAVGIGIYKNFSEAIEELFKVRNIVKPNKTKYLVYQKRYMKYLKVYNLLQQIYQIL